MTFGDRPAVLSPFSEHQAPEDLKKKLKTVTSSSGRPDMARMLAEAERLFSSSGARPEAEKFLVVFVDNKSANDKDSLIESARQLIDSKYWLISVAVGDNANVEELEVLNPLKEATIDVPILGDPDKLAGEIIDEMKKCKYGLFIAVCVLDAPQFAIYTVCRESLYVSV